MKIGYDNNGDDDILDASDDLQASDDFGSNVMSLSYDNNGNLTDDGVMHFVYDAWNRLRKAQRGAAGDTTTFGTYSYYADTRRAGKVVEHCGPEAVANDGGDQTVTFYYGGVPSGAGVSAGLNGVTRWNIFETRNGSGQATRQWVWGTRYVDEVLFMDVNGDPGTNNLCDPDDPNAPAGTKRYHYHQDRNWNVVALTEGAGGVDGRIAERYSFTPYGEFVVIKGDGGSGTLGGSLPTSLVGSVHRSHGVTFDYEIARNENRRRVRAVERFLQRDPLLQRRVPNVRDGLNPYLTLSANPATRSDPSGLFTCCWAWNTPAFCPSGNMSSRYKGAGTRPDSWQVTGGTPNAAGMCVCTCEAAADCNYDCYCCVRGRFTFVTSCSGWATGHPGNPPPCTFVIAPGPMTCFAACAAWGCGACGAAPNAECPG